MSRPRPRGRLGGLAGGHLGPDLGGGWGGCPGPGVCIPACTEVDPPPSRWLLLQAVRILLECILVKFIYSNI